MTENNESNDIVDSDPYIVRKYFGDRWQISWHVLLYFGVVGTFVCSSILMQTDRWIDTLVLWDYFAIGSSVCLSLIVYAKLVLSHGDLTAGYNDPNSSKIISIKIAGLIILAMVTFYFLYEAFNGLRNHEYDVFLLFIFLTAFSYVIIDSLAYCMFCQREAEIIINGDDEDQLQNISQKKEEFSRILSKADIPTALMLGLFLFFYLFVSQEIEEHSFDLGHLCPPGDCIGKMGDIKNTKDILATFVAGGSAAHAILGNILVGVNMSE